MGLAGTRHVERKDSMSSDHPSEHEPEAVLHLYPLGGEHEDDRIVGSLTTLTALRDQLEYIVEHGSRCVHRGYYAADGEGYDLTVELLDKGCHDPTWDGLPEPYYVTRRAAREHGMDV